MSTIAQPSGQTLLLDVAPRYRIEKNAQARNAYGSVAQEIACAALNLDAIPINGSCKVCFDAKHRTGEWYVEIKSVHRAGKVVIYAWRMLKEANTNISLDYAILCHNVKGASGENLTATFNARGLELIVLPAAVVHVLAEQQPLNQIKASTRTDGIRMGYDRNGYKDGYHNVPVHQLRQAAGSHVELREFWLHDVLMSVSVRSQQKNLDVKAQSGDKH